MAAPGTLPDLGLLLALPAMSNPVRLKLLDHVQPPTAARAAARAGIGGGVVSRTAARVEVAAGGGDGSVSGPGPGCGRGCAGRPPVAWAAKAGM